MLDQQEEYALAQSRALVAESATSLIQTGSQFLEDYAATDSPKGRAAVMTMKNILQGLKCFDLLLDRLQDKDAAA